MTTYASLERPSVEVTPGEEATCLLEVRNEGHLVESYTTEVIGEAAAWTVVEPAEFSVYPGTSERVTLHFRPPRSAQITAGELPYAVRVTSVEHPDDVVVPEGSLQILPFIETAAEIVPRTSRGRWGASHEVSVDNRSNRPLTLTLGGSDPDARLDLVFRPEKLQLGAGQAAFVKVKARPRKVLWQGYPVTHPFQVLVQPEDEAPPTALDASTVQVPILPRNLGRVVAALVVMALALAGIWWGLLRPAVRSAAREATQEQIAPLEQKANEANTKAEQAAGAAATASSAAAAPRAPAAGGAPPAAGGGNPAPPRPQVPQGAIAFSERLAATTPNGGSRSDQYTVPDDRTFVITDIILQNPQGDEGRLDLVVDGATVLTTALNNFRDLDYHFVSPIETTEGRVVSIRVTCRRAGPPLAGAGASGQCRNFALLSGYLRGPEPTPTAIPTTPAP